MQASKVAPPQLSTDQKPTWSSLGAMGSMSSRRRRVARMDWWASRSTTSVMPSGLLFETVMGFPFPGSGAARAVKVNRGPDGGQGVCIGRRRRGNLLGRRGRRLADEAAGQEGHQANAEDQQNQEDEDRTHAE